MKVGEAVRAAASRLSATSDTARLDAELLMAHVLGCSRSDLLLRHMDGDALPHLPAFATLVDRRAEREPVAYIFGKAEFFGREFNVTLAVLIPRPDSETVVQAALDAARPDARVLDCGVGSGALLLTFLAERPEATGLGIDASGDALRVAAGNADALGLAERAQLAQRDWTMPGWSDDLGRFDLVIANPPYVEEDADLAPDVRNFEPETALFSGPEGLDDYRILIPQIADLLKEEGVAVLEIGASQAAAVCEIAEKQGFTAEVRRDLAGRDRAITLRLRLGKDESSS